MSHTTTLALEHPFNERFEYAEVISVAAGKSVRLYYGTNKGGFVEMPYDRYTLSVSRGQMISKAEYERYVDEMTGDANEPSAPEEVQAVENPVEVATVTPSIQEEEEVNPEPEPPVKALSMNQVSVRTSWYHLADGFYWVRTEAAFKKALQHFNAGDISECFGKPQEYPAVVAFSHGFGANAYVQACAISCDTLAERMKKIA